MADIVGEQRRLVVCESDLRAKLGGLPSGRDLPVGFLAEGRFHAGVILQVMHLDKDGDYFTEPGTATQPVLVLDFPFSVEQAFDVVFKRTKPT